MKKTQVTPCDPEEGTMTSTGYRKTKTATRTLTKTSRTGMPQIDTEFDTFEASRSKFVKFIAEKASRPENIDSLMDNHVLEMLRPLLLDYSPTVQQAAALAFGRLANYSEIIAQMIVEQNILSDIVAGIASNNLQYQRNCAFVIRTISRHNPDLAQYCVDAGCLDPLVSCLSSCDCKVREAATWALGFIAYHSADLAKGVVDAHAVPSIITGVQDPELSLQRIAVQAIGNIAKQNEELANSVIQLNAIGAIAPLIRSQDPKLKQQVCITLASIAKHSTNTANLVVEGEVFPQALLCLNDKDAGVRKGAASLVQQIVKQTQELAKYVVVNGGAAALVMYLKNGSNDPLSALMAIGYISAWSQSLATALINESAPTVVLNVLITSTIPEVKTAASWALGQIGKHSPEHAARLNEIDSLHLLLKEHNEATSSEIQEKTKRAMELIIEKTTDVLILQPLIKGSQNEILEAVLKQISILLPKNPKARVPFCTSGGFPEVQHIKAEPGSKLQEYIDAINACYPEQAMRYYSPDYPAALIQAIENSEI